MLRFLIKTAIFLVLAGILALTAFRFAASLREQQPQTTAPARGTLIKTSELAFYIQSAGPKDGVPLLMAHGTAAWSGFWERELHLLADAGFLATAFDMPPFGYSDRAADRNYSRARQADRVLALVATMPTPPIMIAHSFGAAAVTEAVLREPDAFAGLIIVDGAIGMETAPTEAKLPLPLRPRPLRRVAISATATNPLATGFLLRSMMHNKAAATDKYIEVLQQPQSRTGTTAAFADWLPSLLAPAAHALSRNPAHYNDLPIPVRIIWGDKDTVTPPSQAEALAAALGQGEVVYLNKVGHIPHIEAPEAFMAALLAALKDIVDTPPRKSGP